MCYCSFKSPLILRIKFDRRPVTTSPAFHEPAAGQSSPCRGLLPFDFAPYSRVYAVCRGQNWKQQKEFIELRWNFTKVFFGLTDDSFQRTRKCFVASNVCSTTRSRLTSQHWGSHYHYISPQVRSSGGCIRWNLNQDEKNGCTLH